MQANLVRPAGSRTCFEQGCCVESFQHLKSRFHRLDDIMAVGQAHADRLTGIDTKEPMCSAAVACMQLEMVFHGRSANNREVAFFDDATEEEFLEP